MISMRVRENNPLNAAVSGPSQRIEVPNISRPRIDDPAPDDV